MNVTLMFRVVCYASLVVALVTVGIPAPADVITTGDVDPGGAATQPEPWEVGGELEVGDLGIGTLNVDAGSMVSNTKGYIGRKHGSTGEATVAGNDFHKPLTPSQ